MELRDYQRGCLEAVRQRYLGGVRRQLVCLPTGTGKTVIFAQFPQFFRMRHRMLVLAHREELLDQARDKIVRANPRLRVDVEQAGRHAGPESDVVVASVPTLGRKSSRRIGRLNPDEFYLIVVDEAHHAPAASYRRALEHFGVFAEGTPKLLVGFTATPKRGDGLGLDAVFQEIVYARTLPEMIEAEFLAPLAAYRVETDVDLSRVRTRLGDFVTRQLSEAVNVEERNALIVKVYRDRLDGRPTLVFCVDVAHTLSLAEGFRAAGIPCAAVTGDMEGDARAAALADFGSGRVRVLTNCMVLTEGYDEPSVPGIILARPTKSALLYTQMIGRGTRLHPGKKNVTVIDVVDVTRQHRIVDLPSLFGLPSNFDLQGRTTREVERAFAWVEAHRPWVRTDRATSLADLRYRCRRVDLFDLRTPDELEDLSEYAWVKAGPQYRLSLAHGERLLVAPTILGEWEIMRQAPGEEEPVGRARDMARAIREADRFVDARRKESMGLVLRRSRWRWQPASEKQRTILAARKIEVPRGLTKGQASHIIAMLPRPAGRGSGEAGA